MDDFKGTENFLRNDPVWQAFFLNTLDCVLDVDFETQELRCSDSLMQNLRLPSPALPRTLEQWLELFHPDDYDKNLEFRSRVFEGTENAFSLERRLYCGDGVYRLFRMNAVCLRDAQGKIKRLIAVETYLPDQDGAESSDRIQPLENEISLLRNENEQLTTRLSQKILQKETLEKSVRVMTRMLDATPDLLFRCDAAGRLLNCNEVFSNALAHNPDLAEWAANLAKKCVYTAEDEGSYRDANGRTRALAAEVRSIEEDGYAGMARDVTEEEETRADMERLKRLLAKYTLASETDKTIPLHEAVAEPQGMDLNTALELRLQKAYQAFSPVSSLFPTRAGQLENLVRTAKGTELEVGVLGITSSGKSAFINAMMGEQLLPEETRATTNLVIRCRKGNERSIAVISRNGGRKNVSGPQLTAAWVESVTSERLNPNNEQDAAFLEWTSPGAALPEGLVLVDTPGLDACDFPEHSELVLRRLLPNLDIVLYVTSIRNRFKAADLELLEAVLEHDQRVIFLLSQIDLEQDDMEGGKVVLSRGQKLSSYVSELYQDIDNNFPEGSHLRGASVVAVSSKLAAAYFYDRGSEEWGASNFDTLIGQLEIYRANLSRCKFETRGRRAVVLLSRSASDAELAIGELSAERARAEEAIRLEKVRDLREAQRWANAEISAVRNEWRRQLDPEYHLQRLQWEIETANTVKGIKDCYERWGEVWSDLVVQMTNRMDRARRSCLDILSRHGISPDGRAAAAVSMKNILPAFNQYVVHEVQEVRVRGWFEALEFWPRYSVFFKQKVDKDKMMEDAKEMMTGRLHLLNDHLSWWENRMREDYCDPLYGELSREDVALSDARRAASDVSASRKALYEALLNIREAERGIRDALIGLTLSEEFDRDMARSRDENEFLAGLTDLADTAAVSADAVDYGFFAPLMASLEEQNIQSRFLGLDALRRRKRIVLLGLRRHDSLRLLSRLAHDAVLFDSMKTEDGREIDGGEWIFRGAIPPAMPHVKVNLPDTLLRELDVLVAPSDGLCSSDELFPAAIDWNDLFAEWLPVVHLDIARIDSGLSDLARAPYASALAHVDHWVAASGQGALFNARLTDLLTDVPERLEMFAARRDYKGQAEWFVYENYDARYTDFMLWGQDMDWNSDSGGTEDSRNGLLRKWLSSGHNFKYPFSESRMRMAIEGARRKLMKTSIARVVPND